MSLKIALQEFAKTFNNTVGNFGSVRFIYTSEIQYPSTLPAGILLNYYKFLQIERGAMIGNAFLMDLVSVDELMTSLLGWRWKKTNTIIGDESEENSKWKKSWVIIGSRNGDVVFVDTDFSQGSIFGCLPAGAPFVISESLASFYQCLTECMKIERDIFNYETFDEDFNRLKLFLKRVRIIACQHLGEEGTMGFMKFFFE